MKKSERFLMGLIEQGVFEIDDLGRIWRLKIRGSKYKDYHLLPKRRRAESKNGAYFEVHVSYQGEKYRAKAHRLVWIHEHGDIDNALTINHLSGNKTNNCLDNLELISLKDNLLHAHKVGLISGASPGEEHPMSRLNEKDVLEVLRLYQTGEFSQSKLGKMFDVSQSQIGRIVRGDRWKYLKRDNVFSRQGAAKLSPSDVRLIRVKYKSGETEQNLSQEFGVGLTQIKRIITREAWKHVE